MLTNYPYQEYCENKLKTLANKKRQKSGHHRSQSSRDLDIQQIMMQQPIQLQQPQISQNLQCQSETYAISNQNGNFKSEDFDIQSMLNKIQSNQQNNNHNLACFNQIQTQNHQIIDTLEPSEAELLKCGNHTTYHQQQQGVFKFGHNSRKNSLLAGSAGMQGRYESGLSGFGGDDRFFVIPEQQSEVLQSLELKSAKMSCLSNITTNNNGCANNNTILHHLNSNSKKDTQTQKQQQGIEKKTKNNCTLQLDHCNSDMDKDKENNPSLVNPPQTSQDSVRMQFSQPVKFGANDKSINSKQTNLQKQSPLFKSKETLTVLNVNSNKLPSHPAQSQSTKEQQHNQNHKNNKWFSNNNNNKVAKAKENKTIEQNEKKTSSQLNANINLQLNKENISRIDGEMHARIQNYLQDKIQELGMTADCKPIPQPQNLSKLKNTITRNQSGVNKIQINNPSNILSSLNGNGNGNATATRYIELLEERSKDLLLEQHSVHSLQQQSISIPKRQVQSKESQKGTHQCRKSISNVIRQHNKQPTSIFNTSQSLFDQHLHKNNLNRVSSSSGHSTKTNLSVQRKNQNNISNTKMEQKVKLTEKDRMKAIVEKLDGVIQKNQSLEQENTQQRQQMQDLQCANGLRDQRIAALETTIGQYGLDLVSIKEQIKNYAITNSTAQNFAFYQQQQHQMQEVQAQPPYDQFNSRYFQQYNQQDYNQQNKQMIERISPLQSVSSQHVLIDQITLASNSNSNASAKERVLQITRNSQLNNLNNKPLNKTKFDMTKNQLICGQKYDSGCYNNNYKALSKAKNQKDTSCQIAFPLQFNQLSKRLKL